MENLDAVINKISFDIVNKKIVDENQINKMLGVLSNDGVYAWWVYILKELKIKSTYLCHSIFQNDNLISSITGFNNLEELQNLKNDIEKLATGEDKEKKQSQNKFREWQQKMTENFQHLSKDLPSLLFFREILEKILIYARYHAKAMED